MKQVIQIFLDENDVLELIRILIDEDAEGALAFLKKYLKGKAKGLLESG